MLALRDKPTATQQKLAKALAHPIRVQVLTILNERVASPNELSNELGLGLSLVSYHVKVLRDFDCIELVDTKQRRGATEHFYRATARPHLDSSQWAEIPPSVRERISAEAIRMAFDDIAEAVKGGTFESREDRHLSRTPLTVDEQGWKDLASLFANTLDRVLEIQSASSGRLAESDDEGIAAKAVILHFESPPAKA